MEAAAIAMSQPKTTMHQFCKIGAFHSNLLSFPVRINQLNNHPLKKEVVKCAKKGDSVSASEKKLVVEKEEELNIEEELKKLNGKCREIGGGIVELMECLEREAILGEDEGREATDYSKRALIFDRSSRVFQALKQQQSPTEEVTSSSAGAASCV